MQTASGFSVENPLQLLRGFVNDVYPMYDGIEVAQDNQLRVVEIALSTMLNSRISGNTGGKIWTNRAIVEASLSQIPSHIDLLNITPGEPIPAETAIEQAIDSMCKVPRCKLAVATKILHKKRPGLIPIFDSFVAGHYRPRLTPAYRHASCSWGRKVTGLTRLVRADLDSVRDELQELRGALEENHTPLTGCRILNALMWAVLSRNDHRLRELAS
jgi:Family of unknown function (DUF6308)